MSGPRFVIRSFGGLAATHELRALGVGRKQLAAALSSNRVIRVRRGWYALPETHPTLRNCARIGGPATCTTGLALHGCWVVRDARLHVRVDPHAVRLRDPHRPGRRLGKTGLAHWRERSADAGAASTRLILDPLSCLRDAMDCLTVDLLCATADSLLHQRLVSRTDWRQFVLAAPRRLRTALAHVDGVCESGTETVFWRRLSGRVAMRRQVEIAGVGRVDFLIGDRLIVEVDGRDYHVDVEQFEADRQRDALLSAIGYRVLRFSFTQVLERWAEVELAVLAACARGDQY